MQPRSRLHAHVLRVSFDPPPPPARPVESPANAPNPAPVGAMHPPSAAQTNATAPLHDIDWAVVTREASPGPSKMPPPAKKQHPCPPGTARRSGGAPTTPRFGRLTSPCPGEPAACAPNPASGGAFEPSDGARAI